MSACGGGHLIASSACLSQSFERVNRFVTIDFHSIASVLHVRPDLVMSCRQPHRHRQLPYSGTVSRMKDGGEWSLFDHSVFKMSHISSRNVDTWPLLLITVITWLIIAGDLSNLRCCYASPELFCGYMYRCSSDSDDFLGNTNQKDHSLLTQYTNQHISLEFRSGTADGCTQPPLCM